jgi:hypothetical protein
MALGVIRHDLVISDRGCDAGKCSVRRALDKAKATTKGASASRDSERQQCKGGESFDHRHSLG